VRGSSSASGSPASDLDARLREVLERKAAEVPPHLEVPRKLRSRSRRRIALNGAAVAVVVLCLAGAALGGLRAIERRGAITPGKTETVDRLPSATASASPALDACGAGELRADAQLEGAAGSRVGTVLVSNYSSTPCTLSGPPAIVVLLADAGTDDDVAIKSSAPSWRVEDRPKPPGWPVVTLAPGDVASLRLRWANWCPDGRPGPLWAIDMPDGRLPIQATDGISPPPCLDSSANSTVEVGPFEPAVS
jgi:hypothetical protein